VGEEPTHDRVAGVKADHRTDQRRPGELRGNEGQPRPVPEERRQRHAAFPRSTPPLYSAAHARTGGLLILSREHLARLAEDLLSRPLFAQALAGALKRGLETKGAIDRNVQTVLSLLNLPSRADLNRLLTKLEIIQGNLTNLSLKVDRLEAAQRRATKRPRKPRGGSS
jgi:hypothetical protein